MPKTALIIEDDEAGGKLLSELCSKLSLEVTLSRNGKEGLEKAKIQSPDLIVLDMLLPGLDGFKVVEGLRAAGVASALVVVTGVYKDAKVAKEFQEKYGAEFFLKPIKPDAFSAAVARRLRLVVAPTVSPSVPRKTAETPAAAMGPMEGTLETKGYPALLMELYRGKASGVLDLKSGQMKKRLYLNRGFVRFAQSNIKVENVGGMQVAEGKLAEDQYSAAVARARAENIGVGEALATAGLLSYEAVAAATRRQVEEVCVSAFPWQEGVFKFTPGSTENVQDVRHNPLQVLLAGVKRFVSADVARERLLPLEKGTASRGADFDRELYTMRNLFNGETVTPMLNGRLKVAEIVAKARPQDLPLLWGLLHTTMATLSGVELSAKAAVSAPTRAFTQEEEAARALVDAEHLRVARAADLYLVLKVPRTATGEAIKAAYLPLAKRFHADAFSGLSLGDAEGKAREVFGKLAEANATLCDPKKRADYDVLLDRKDKGLPTDLDVIFRAEAAANRADALLKQGRTGDAEAAAKEALKLDASVAQYHVTLGQAILKGRGATSASEARGCFDKALSLNPEFHTAAVFKAMALELEGEPKQAEKLLREVLLAQPENVDAARELRALKERSRKDENKGLLSKFFKR